MKNIILTLLLLLFVVSTCAAKHDIYLDQDYDPRIELRVVVLPALKMKSLNKVNERTISALFSTELLRTYEILDLIRFEQFISDRKFTLENAFSIKAQSVIQDSAQVDAIASVEIFRWDEGTGGIPIMGKKAGSIGMRLRLMDPFTGRVYWSVNRISKVSPNTEFLVCASKFFRELVTDLEIELYARVLELEEAGHYQMVADNRFSRGQRSGNRKFTSLIEGNRKSRNNLGMKQNAQISTTLEPVNSAPRQQQMLVDTTMSQSSISTLLNDPFEDIESTSISDSTQYLFGPLPIPERFITEDKLQSISSGSTIPEVNSNSEGYEEEE
jgi:hypothetical protein